jgi:hypothetical protein
VGGAGQQGAVGDDRAAAVEVAVAAEVQHAVAELDERAGAVGRVEDGAEQPGHARAVDRHGGGVCGVQLDVAGDGQVVVARDGRRHRSLEVRVPEADRVGEPTVAEGADGAAADQQGRVAERRVVAEGEQPPPQVGGARVAVGVADLQLAVPVDGPAAAGAAGPGRGGGRRHGSP